MQASIRIRPTCLAHVCLTLPINSWPNVDGGGGLLIANLCRLAREYCKRITSARARRKGLIDIEMIQDVIPEVERLDALTDIFKQKLLSLYGSTSDIPAHLIFWIKVMRSLCESVFTDREAA